MTGFTEPGWIEGLARHGADRVALLADGVSVDFESLAARSASTANRLHTLGVESGDLVAVLALPSVAGVALIHAMFDQQIVLFPLNGRLSESEQRDALESTKARFLIVAQDVDGDLAKRLCEAAGCGLIIFSSAASSHHDSEFIRAASPRLSTTDEEAERRIRRLEEKAALVLQTSGTSGRAKAVVLGLDHLVASAKASAQLLGTNPKDRWLLCMPLFHIAGLSILIRSALFGSCVVVHRRFDVGCVARALDEDRITHVSFVAAMLAAVLEARGDRVAPESLSLVLLGGGPAPQSLLSRSRELQYPIAPTYGLTEAASQVATRPPDAAFTNESDLAEGLEPLPGVEIRIVDSEGKIVAAGVEGEIQVRGPMVMRAYLDDRVSTSKAIREGWLSTGDVGRLDRAGRLRVIDRRADLIVSGGENIYPAEIESVLVAHPDILDGGVVGVSDSKFGRRPVAFVVLRPGTSLDRAELTSFCRDRLASYKIPIDFVEVPVLPRTPSGKLLRRALTTLNDRSTS